MAAVQVGTIFIENRPLIMRPLNLESESYSGTWGVLQSLTSSNLDQKVRGAGWHCGCLAEEVKATVFGTLTAKNIRKALEQIFLQARKTDFNCLEITKIAGGRFLGIPRTIVCAHSRHIRQGSIMQMVDEHKNAKPVAA